MIRKKMNHLIGKVTRRLGYGFVTAESAVTVSARTIWLQQIDTGFFEIEQISVSFGTFQRKNTCRIDIRLFSASDELLHHETVAGETLVDNANYALKLSEGFMFKGVAYLAITSPDAKPENCVALWTTWDVGGAGLREVSRVEGEVITTKAFTKLGKVHPSVGLSITLCRRSLTGAHAHRSYLKPYVAGDVNFHSQRMVGLVGFSIEDLQTLSTLNRQAALQLQELQANEMELASNCQILLISGDFDIDQGRSLAKFARHKKIPLFVVTLGDALLPKYLRDAWPAFVDGLITSHTQPASRLPQHVLDQGLESALEGLLKSYRIRHAPKVSIVTILSGKADQLKWVIQSYFDQTYKGEIEVVYINDGFGGDAESVVAEEFAKHSARPHNAKLSYTTLLNERNMGNCASRNRGVSKASGDIIVIIDADCMINPQFIAAHVNAHAYFDCEVVIGPHNIETHGAPPLEKLAQIGRKGNSALEASDLQDPMFLDGFLNCITRNFSIKKSAVIEDLFDLNFSYSLAQDSGFGWEDVEMGYRLYKRGLGIKFSEDAFSVHITHGSSIPEAEKPRRSIRNFRKLFLKHPELHDVARRWAAQTLKSLDSWSVKMDPSHSTNLELVELKKQFEDAPSMTLLGAAKRRRKLRILTYRWHVPHQYELYKSGHDFFLVRGAGSPMCDQWEFGQRPLPQNVSFIDIWDVKESEFDMALLHFDENVLNHENSNGKIGPEWGATFRFFVEKINLPKVAICHGTPQFYGQYTPGYDKPDLMTVNEPARAALVQYVKDIEIVCNSYQAQQEWGFHKSRVIWHGFDPSEFLPCTYSKGILSPMGPLVKSRPHYRGFYLYQKVFSPEFPQAFLPEALTVPNPDIDYAENVFAIAKYKNYIEQIRQYSVYFNPTLRSPMPRARCEPMMCGVVTVSANNHDVDLFIKNGVNGFYSSDPDELREQLLYLMRNPDATRKIGGEARKTAINVFNHDRYLADWSVLLKSVV